MYPVHRTLQVHMHVLCFVYLLRTLYFVLYSNPVCFIHDDLINPEIIREQGTVRSTLSCHQAIQHHRGEPMEYEKETAMIVIVL